MKSKKMVIAAATLAMIGAASVGPAMAYFTDSHIVTGQVVVDLGDSELYPHEELDTTGFEKTVVVENTGKYDVFIRVKAYSGSTVNVDFKSGSKWELVNGYYEYTQVVKANGQTEPIVFTVTPPADSEFQDDFNVIIYEEATRAVYGEDGTATKDWNLAIKKQTEVNPPEEQPAADEPVPEQPVNNGEEGETNED